MAFYIPNDLDGATINMRNVSKKDFDAYGSTGVLRAIGRYARNLSAALGVVYVLGGLPGCGGGPAAPTPTTCNPACVTPQTCVNNGGNYSCQNPTPPSSLVITKPAISEKPATPLDIEYTSNSQSANHADFTIDNGEVYHDTTLDGKFQLPEKKPDGTDIISGGSHTLRGYLVDASENKLAGSDAAVPFSVISVTGDITDRIVGGGVGGSTITWSGPVTKSARANSPYTINGLTPGDYQVTISGNHVEHKTLKVLVSDSGSFPFSVLQWGSGRFGAVYDATFNGFFDKIARVPGHIGQLEPGMFKWNLSKISPREIYVVENSSFTGTAFTEFMDILREVNNENISDMFCGKVAPLPIRTGPPVNDSNDGGIIVRFVNGGSGGDPNFQLYDLVGGKINYDITDLTNFDRNRRKYMVNHEMFHVAFALHAFNTYRDSAMGGGSDITRLSKEDKLAACIVYNDDTHPGNKAPDTNPTYR